MQGVLRVVRNSHRLSLAPQSCRIPGCLSAQQFSGIQSSLKRSHLLHSLLQISAMRTLPPRLNLGLGTDYDYHLLATAFCPGMYFSRIAGKNSASWERPPTSQKQTSKLVSYPKTHQSGLVPVGQWMSQVECSCRIALKSVI